MFRYAPLALTVAWALRSSATTEHNNDGHPKVHVHVAAVRRLRRPAPITESDLGNISPGRTLQGGGFDQKELIETADSLFCAPGLFSQPFSINVSIDQTPVSVPPEDQCNSACDCKGRCCSNTLYYIDAQSAFGPGSNEGGGGVCVEIPSDITDAAKSTCNFGLANMSETTKPPTPTPASKPSAKPKPDDDQAELSMRRLDRTMMTNWLDEIKDFRVEDFVNEEKKGRGRNAADKSRDDFKLMRLNAKRKRFRRERVGV